MKSASKPQGGLHDFFKRSCDFRDVFVQRGFSSGVRFTLCAVKHKNIIEDSGAGFRTVSGDYTRYSSAGLDGNIFELLDKNGISPPAEKIFPGPDLTAASGYFKELDALMRERGRDRIKNIDLSLSVSGRQKYIWTDSGGIESEIYRTVFAVEVITSSGSSREFAAGHLVSGSPADAEFFERCRSKSLAALSTALDLLEAPPAPSGAFPVLIGREAGGTLVHEAVGHSLEADAVRHGISPVYSGKINERVASEAVTIIDDPTLPGKNGSYDYDDEGTPSGKTVLIEKGVLRNFLTDRKEALLSSMPANGHGRRESFRYRPIPRMGVTYLAPGQYAREEMLKKMGRGLYVAKMGGGQVNPANGDFVFEARECYLVEGGRKKGLLKPVVLAGNGPEILRKLKYVGAEGGWDDGTCGKDGQSAPVSDGMPDTLIYGIIVGGR